MPTLNGLNVILNVNMTEPGEPRVRVRSWRERLTQPVRLPDLLRLPSLLRASVTYVPLVPSRHYYMLAGGSVVMHPAIVESLVVGHAERSDAAAVGGQGGSMTDQRIAEIREQVDMLLKHSPDAMVFNANTVQMLLTEVGRLKGERDGAKLVARQMMDRVEGCQSRLSEMREALKDAERRLREIVVAEGLLDDEPALDIDGICDRLLKARAEAPTPATPAGTPPDPSAGPRPR